MRAPSRNRARVLLASLATLFVLVHGGRATAAPPRLDATEARATCPSPEALRAAIVQQLGKDDFDRDDAPVVDVRIRRGAGDVLAADVTITSARQGGAVRSRSLEGDTCEDLVRAAALAIALALEEEAARPPAPPSSPPPPAPAPRDEPPTESAAPVAPARFMGTAEAVTTVGLVPRPASGAGAAVGYRVGDNVVLSAKGFFLPAAAMPDDSFALRLLAAGAGACVEPTSRAATTIIPFGCAHAWLGSYDVKDATVAMRDEGALFASLSASLGARARVAGPLHLAAVVDAHVPLVRPTVLTVPCPPVGFEPPFMALSVGVGAGVSIF